MAIGRKKIRKFGLGGGIHSSKRKALGYGRKAYQYSCQFKEGAAHVLVIRRSCIRKKLNRKTAKKRALKKFYQLYRSAETGQLRKRYVKRYYSGVAEGYRFINLGSLQEHVSEISLHSATCKKAIDLGLKGISPVEITSEVDTFGLVSVISSKCKGCLREIMLTTSPKLSVHKSSQHFDINVRAVWGSIVTGNGRSQLNEFLATTDSPGISQKPLVR